MPTREAIRWFKSEFADEISAAIAGTPYTLDFIVAIACQETGYIWASLYKQGMPTTRILELCVGDTIDDAGGRSAFPKNKAALIAKPRGQDMFDVARAALVDMAAHVPGYAAAAAKAAKFCHGFGVFQYDLQFFTVDPDYFLARKYVSFDNSLAKCIQELKSAQIRNGWATKTALTEMELIGIAIAYNAGRYNPAKGLKQGFFNKAENRYYGEYMLDFLRLARSVSDAGDSTPPVAGEALLSAPSPVTAIGPVYAVKTMEGSLRVRREPRIDAANVVANLPDGHLVRSVTGQPVSGFLEIETSLDGALIRGFSSAKFLEPRPDNPSIPVEVPATEAPQTGLVAVLMPRGPNTPITRRINPAGAHSLNEPGQPSRTGTTPAELREQIAAIVEWLAADKPTHKRYKPRDGLTFCNIYAHDFCHLAGVYLPRVWWTPKAVATLVVGGSVEPLYNDTIVELRANDLFRWLRDFGLQFGWRQTGTLTKLQTEANQGGLGIIVARRKEDGKSGHIVMVVPETADNSAKRAADGEVTAPLQSQAGATNFRYGTGRPDWWRGEEFAEFAYWLHA